MQLKRQSEIAISILATCARQPERKIPAQELADEAHATMASAYQVVSMLVRNGLLKSDRGPGGGVRLARKPEEIGLADVLRLTQPDFDRASAEPDSGPATGTETLLDRISATTASFFVRLLGRFTVADLVAPDTAVGVPCLDCRLVSENADEARSIALEKRQARTRPSDKHISMQYRQ